MEGTWNQKGYEECERERVIRRKRIDGLRECDAMTKQTAHSILDNKCVRDTPVLIYRILRSGTGGVPLASLDPKTGKVDVFSAAPIVNDGRTMQWIVGQFHQMDKVSSAADLSVQAYVKNDEWKPRVFGIQPGRYIQNSSPTTVARLVGFCTTAHGTVMLVVATAGRDEGHRRLDLYATRGDETVFSGRTDVFLAVMDGFRKYLVAEREARGNVPILLVDGWKDKRNVWVGQ